MANDRWPLCFARASRFYRLQVTSWAASRGTSAYIREMISRQVRWLKQYLRQVHSSGHLVKWAGALWLLLLVPRPALGKRSGLAVASQFHGVLSIVVSSLFNLSLCLVALCSSSPSLPFIFFSRPHHQLLCRDPVSSPPLQAYGLLSC